MNSKTKKNALIGALAAYILAALALISSAKLGLLPVEADATPSSLEAALLGSALRASIARRAPNGGNPLPASEDNLAAGAKLYRDMCARCHGLSKDSDNAYGRSFYPPAPRLALGTSYTDSEIFWIIKHGIRNTGMPAWGRLLSDDETWQIVTVLRSASD